MSDGIGLGWVGMVIVVSFDANNYSNEKSTFTNLRKIARLYTSGLRSHWDRRHAQCWRWARHNVNLSYFCVAAFVTLNKRLFWWKEMLAFNKVVIKFGHVSKVSCLQERNSRASAAIYAELAPVLQSGFWIVTLLLIDFALLLQNIYKFEKITWLFKVKYCLADCFRRKGYTPLGGKMFAKRIAYEEKFFGGFGRCPPPPPPLWKKSASIGTLPQKCKD